MSAQLQSVPSRTPPGSYIVKDKKSPPCNPKKKEQNDETCLLCGKKRHNYKICFFCTYCEDYGHKEDKCLKKGSEICPLCKKFHSLEECEEFKTYQCPKCSAVGKHLAFFCR
jgi:hypothetical protein